jgi:ABC-type lipoprotein release transport system permease subunit
MKAAVLPLAWRNILRHGRRSLITIAAIAIGLAALLFLWGLNDGIHSAMIRNFQSTFVGSLQINQQGFFNQPKPGTYIRNSKVVIAALETTDVKRWTPRLQSFALAAGADTSAGMLLVGVDPRREPTVIDIADKVVKGRFLEAGDAYTCILGSTSARNLKVDIGDSVILLAQGRDGALAAERYTLVGIIASGVPDIDRGMVLAPLPAVQEMLGMPGRLTSIIARVPEGRLAQVVADLRRTLGSKGLEVLRWNDMFPVIQEWVTLENGFYYIFLGVVLMVVVAGVLNTVLISMLERRREFGILMALGTRSREIGAMVIAESLIIGATGTLLGSLLGLGLVGLYGHIGIDLSFMSESLTRFYVDPVVYTKINTDHLLITVLAVLGTTSASTLYPAWKATRWQPVEAMRYV